MHTLRRCSAALSGALIVQRRDDSSGESEQEGNTVLRLTNPACSQLLLAEFVYQFQVRLHAVLHIEWQIPQLLHNGQRFGQFHSGQHYMLKVHPLGSVAGNVIVEHIGPILGFQVVCCKEHVSVNSATFLQSSHLHVHGGRAQESLGFTIRHVGDGQVVMHRGHVLVIFVVVIVFAEHVVTLVVRCVMPQARLHQRLIVPPAEQTRCEGGFESQQGNRQ
mmetsp:Transcript_4364/g.7451  ORF Transcript_4364/g.7451 Transcript_4364/m.7451 type:complete len:219 (+) Transcript_4364:20-676(+)